MKVLDKGQKRSSRRKDQKSRHRDLRVGGNSTHVLLQKTGAEETESAAGRSARKTIGCAVSQKGHARLSGLKTGQRRKNHVHRLERRNPLRSGADEFRREKGLEWLQIARVQTCMFRNSRQHFRPDFDTVMEGPRVVRPSWTG